VYNDLDVHNFGSIIKAARENSDLTRDQLSERAGIGYRHLMGIENKNKTPSIFVLFRIIRALGISADTIVYPEKNIIGSEKDKLYRMLSRCTEQEIRAFTAMLDVLLSDRK